MTDDLPYMQATEALLALQSSFCLHEKLTNPEGYGNSYFDTLWREKGRTIHYAQYYTK